MALLNRGLNNKESMALSMKSITASGVEDIVKSPCFLYKLILSEPVGAENVICQLADGTSTAGARETADLSVVLASGNATAGGGERTRVLEFNPPIHFTSGIVVSSTGLQTAAASAHGGVLTILYKA